YVVLFPSVLYYPYADKVHIHLMDLDEPMRVTLHLVSSHGIPNVTLEKQGSDVLQLNWPRFSNISTPPAGTYKVAHLHVSIQGGSLQVSEQKQVLVKALELRTLVQTDKDVYQPGQNGEGQELLEEHSGSWNETSMFGSQALPLTSAPAFADPSGNRMAEWWDVSPQQGIVDLSFVLAAEPALGTYIIEVESKRYHFSVKDHGLPCFEVLIWLPRIVTVKDEKIPLDVCGWYPSGKTFRGRAEARLCQTHKYLLCGDLVAANVGDSLLQTGRNSCFSTEVLVTSFNLTGFYKSRLYAYATLAGGRDWNVTAKHAAVVAAALLSTPTVLCCYCIPLRASISTPQAELKDDPPTWEHEDKKYCNYPSAYRYLYPISSDSESFLKIRRVEKKLPCGQTQKLRVDYLFDEKAMGIELQSLDGVLLVR
ncbi:A2ML1 protein, partial [Pluvianellus socialis]|nr:A2ML1 protein [Pluvianellus socialis]